MTLRVYQIASPKFGIGHPAPYVALVEHRMVGTLGSTDTTFTTGTRPASTNFGIGTCTKGHPNDGVCVHQYVRLGDQHWGNGNWDPSGVWDDWYPTTAINSRTVSIEHEDNGGAPLGSGRKGVITEAIWQRSIELDRLLLSGDIAAMKAAGITFRSGTEAAISRELKAIVPGPRTILKHNDIAGKLKPYCLSPWADDKIGFPRERFITELSREVPPVDAFNIPEFPTLLTLPAQTVLYDNDALGISPGNITISPGRDFPLVGKFASGTRIVAYQPAGATVPHSYFTKAAVGSEKPAPPPPVPVPNCDAAAKTAANEAIDKVRDALPAVLAGARP